MTRSTRARPAKAPLSEEAVVAAALTILRSEGLEAVTMRRVATALDTGPASLYVYVSGRDALLGAMLDRVVAGIELEPVDPARWRDQLGTLLQRVREALAAHPGIAATTLADPPPTEALLRLTENLLGLLLAAGVTAQEAAWAGDVLLMVVTASVIETDERRAHGRDDDGAHAAKLRETFVGLPADRFPLIAGHVAQLVAGDRDERFRFAVDVVIDGVVARSTSWSR